MSRRERTDYKKGHIINSKNYGLSVYGRAISENITTRAHAFEIYPLYRIDNNDPVTVSPKDVSYLPERAIVAQAIEKLRGSSSVGPLPPDKTRAKVLNSENILDIATLTRKLYDWMKANGLTLASKGKVPDDFRQGLDLIARVASAIVIANKKREDRLNSMGLEILGKMRKRLNAVLLGHLDDLKLKMFFFFDAETDGIIMRKIVLAAAGRITTAPSKGTNGAKAPPAIRATSPIATAPELAPAVTPVTTAAAARSITATPKKVHEAAAEAALPTEKPRGNGHGGNGHDQPATSAPAASPDPPKDQLWYGGYRRHAFAMKPPQQPKS